jgi:hypothetical protein
MLVSTAIAIVSLGSTSNAMAASPHLKARASAAQAAPQIMYKDLIRPNGHMRSDAVHQADVAACYRQTGASRYLPDSAAMKKCMLSRGYSFMWQRGFATASRQAGSNEDWTPPADTSASDAIGWAAEQSANDASAAAAEQESQLATEMNASNAAAAAQNAEAEDMTNQYMMNEVNSR